MTICCNSCPVSERRDSSSSSHKRAMTVRHRVCKRFRSTKGASKARRDHINGEIRNMRALLPISQEDQERLSYLHSMSVICTFIRKSVLFQGLPAVPGEKNRTKSCLPFEEFLQALPGFIVVMTKEGKLVYVSENVSEYLGFSMVDVLQGDTFYDMVENFDTDIVKFSLEDDGTSRERSFVCRMHTSKAFRLQHGSCGSMLVRGRFQTSPQSSLFVALCTPTVNRLRDSYPLCFAPHFQTLHQPDMRFTQVSDSVQFHLGYTADEMIGQSWYSLLHPDDLSLSVCGHKNLVEEDEDTKVEMVLRVQCKDFTWSWLYIYAAKDSGKQNINCTNYIISETEANFLKQKIHSNTLRVSTQTLCISTMSQMPCGSGDSRSSKRRREASHQCDESRKKTRGFSEPTVHYTLSKGKNSESGSSSVAMGDVPTLFSTPPYSPESSNSSGISEDAASDFLLNAYSGTEQCLSLSPQQASPSYLHCSGSSSPEQDGHFSPSPQPIQRLSDQAYLFSPSSAVSSSFSSPPNPAPSYSLPGTRAETHLVPDYQPTLESCENLSDCVLHPEDLSLLSLPEPQGSVNDFHTSQVPQNSMSSVPSGLLTPDSSPIFDRQFHYSDREQAEISILAHQISSLATSFDIYTQQDPVPQLPQPLPQHTDLSWTHTPTHTPKSELLLDESIIDSILKELDVVPGKEELPCVWSQEPATVDSTKIQTLALDDLVDSLPLEQYPLEDGALNSCILRQAC
ncbi:neuronal PAS domain-containing protein 4-like [Chanos chanos]|uniref:Neuronal PAS domain-containing protein 4-like n=1 Tax=Chanos chanos TaxID=29144 RepID=A0A6J2V8R8_CHACN|nr:neuronal PAS domain-containing protein 4-like [Chanos chanos]